MFIPLKMVLIGIDPYPYDSLTIQSPPGEPSGVRLHRRRHHRRDGRYTPFGEAAGRCKRRGSDLGNQWDGMNP